MQEQRDTPTSRRAQAVTAPAKVHFMLPELSPTASPRASASAASPERSPRARPTSPDSPRSKAAPSRSELGRLFDALDQGWGSLGINELTEAVLEISEKYSLGLETAEVDRMMKFLQTYEDAKVDLDGEERVSRTAFVRGLRGLSLSLAQIRKQNLTAAQVRMVVGAAFEHFDLNNDGMISQEELAAAAAHLGLRLSEMDVAVLHRFIAPSESEQIPKDDVPIWVKVEQALHATVHQTQKRYATHSVDTIIARMSKAPEMPKKPEQQFGWLTQQVAEIAEQWADAFELAVSAAGMAVAAQYAAMNLGAHDLSALDVNRAAPFLTFLALGAMDFAKELDEVGLKEMTVDEALLYALVFKDKGFSQVQFRQLLKCKGCAWTFSEAGEVLNEQMADRLGFVVRGRTQARCHGAVMKAVPGTAIGAARFVHQQDCSDIAVIAKEPVVSITWDVDELQDLLAHDHELSVLMSKVLAGSLADNLKLVKMLQEASATGAAVTGDLAEDPAGLQDGTELTKVTSNSASKRSKAFLEEVRWLRRQLRHLRRRASTPVFGWDCSPVVDVALGWVDTMTSEFCSDVERRGLLRTWYGVKQVLDNVHCPRSLQDSLTQAFNFWHGLDEVVNFNSVLSDYTGAFLLVYGAWHHLSTLNGCGADDFDPTQFMMLVGICGTRASAHLFKKDVHDLTEEEALLFIQGGFKEAGFTPGDFQHLLRGGGARLETLQPGEVKVLGLTEPQLHMVVDGKALVRGSTSQSPSATIAAREFLGQDALGVQDPLLHCPRMQCRLEATEKTSLLVWDVAQLQSELAADANLRRKKLRMVTLSMADRLLRDSLAFTSRLAEGSAAEAQPEEQEQHLLYSA